MTSAMRESGKASCTPVRIQRRRTAGWRMPAGAIYVGRPSPWGNPFEIRGDRAVWLALALGQRADLRGRRIAAVLAHRAWLTDEAIPVPTAPDSGEIEYASGRMRKIADIPVAMGVLMLSIGPRFEVPPRPDLAPLRGLDLVCWCPADLPCHADTLLELANR